MPHAWIMRTTTGLEVGREAGEVGLGADGGERALVDGGAVAEVIELGHARVAPRASSSVTERKISASSRS